MIPRSPQSSFTRLIGIALLGSLPAMAATDTFTVKTTSRPVSVRRDVNDKDNAEVVFTEVSSGESLPMLEFGGFSTLSLAANKTYKVKINYKLFYKIMLRIEFGEAGVAGCHLESATVGNGSITKIWGDAILSGRGTATLTIQ